LPGRVGASLAQRDDLCRVTARPFRIMMHVRCG
jgi:hypothetical protein